MGFFDTGEAAWIARLGNLRNTIRQEIIGRHLDVHIAAGATVLDVGCGQGTQSLRLMGRGCVVTGVEPSSDLLARFRNDASDAGVSPELVQGEIDELDALLARRTFDAVCAHGLLMYLDDPGKAIAQLTERVAPNGMLSITFKNAHGLAMRPAMRQQWGEAIAAFGATQYTNELGVDARSHRLDEVEGLLQRVGFGIDAWYGVRVFNDAIRGDVDPPEGGLLEDVLEAEDLAGRTDPYRWLGSQLHVIATRRPLDITTP